MTSWLAMPNIGQRLVQRAHDGNIEFVLAESLIMQKDGQTFRFTLYSDKLFSDGSELTVDDVIASLKNICLNKNSLSQLGDIIQQPLETGLKKISRYKLEIRLKQRAADLLDRLTLLECTISKEGKQQIFTGGWRKASNEELAIESIPSNAKNHSNYRFIQFQNLPTIHTFDGQFENRAYVMAYPGITVHTPAKGVVSSEDFCELECGFYFYLNLNRSIEAFQDIRTALQLAVKKAFAYSERTRTYPLGSYLHSNHVWYKPLYWHRRGVHLDGKSVKLRLRGAPLNRILLENLAAGCREYGLEIEFIYEDHTSTPSARVHSEYEGVIYTFFCSSIFDGYSFAHFLRHNANLHSPQIKHAVTRFYSVPDVAGQRIAAQEILEALDKSSGLIPLAYTPVMLRSNRGIRQTSNSEHFDFSSILESQEKIAEDKFKQTALSSVGSAVQMIAHDVKKPLSMTSGLLSILQGTNDPKKIKLIIDRYTPQIQRAINSVNAMLQDIMEIGAKTAPLTEPVCPIQLIHSTIGSIFQFEPESDICFSYDFSHTRPLQVESNKTLRVFQNIIMNALQAMGKKGHIWFKTLDRTVSGKSLVEVTIGNDGPLIPKDKQKTIFNLFYTSGKKMGAGLGLAITQKIIEDHGGHICCLSDEERGTEFVFTLPSSSFSTSEAHPILAIHSRELSFKQDNGDPFHRLASQDAEDKTLKIASILNSQKARLMMLVVDDESFYCDLLIEFIKQDQHLNASIELLTAADAKTALEIFIERLPDIVIVDVNLGAKSEDGFSLVKKMREHDDKSKICIHSNGSAFEYQSKSIKAGADLYLPKPMVKAQLVSLIYSLDIIRHNQDNPAFVERKYRVLIVDDDYIYIEAWELIADLAITSYSAAEHVLADLKSGHMTLEAFDVVILDYRLSGGEDGLTLAKELAEINAHLPIVLASEYNFAPEELPPCIRFAVGKDPQTVWPRIRSLIS
jgi:signal transduction histidine kinase/DNA-binding response OmpR family regulator